MKRLIAVFVSVIMVLSLFTLTTVTTEAAGKKQALPRTKLKGVVIDGFAMEYADAILDGKISVGGRANKHAYELFHDQQENLCIFSLNTGSKPTVYTLDANYMVTSKLALEVPKYDVFGNFAVGTDGNYYFVVGYNNKEENPKKVTVKVPDYC
jgi:hypothetical protein